MTDQWCLSPHTLKTSTSFIYKSNIVMVCWFVSIRFNQFRIGWLGTIWFIYWNFVCMYEYKMCCSEFLCFNQKESFNSKLSKIFSNDLFLIKGESIFNESEIPLKEFVQCTSLNSIHAKFFFSHKSWHITRTRTKPRWHHVYKQHTMDSSEKTFTQ